MSQDKVLAIYLTDTEVVDKLVVSTLFFSSQLQPNSQYHVRFHGRSSMVHFHSTPLSTPEGFNTPFSPTAQYQPVKDKHREVDSKASSKA